jgi:DNA repair exonuclease SbcCD ATPase subunit
MGIASMALKALLGNGNNKSLDGYEDVEEFEFESGDEVQEAEQQREKEVKNIKQLADRARRYMGDAERNTDNEEVKKIEDEVRQNMRNVVDIVSDVEGDFETVHANIEKAESSGEGLAEAEDEVEDMMSETETEFRGVERLAEQSLTELKKVDEVAAGEQVKRDAEESIKKVEKIEKLAGNVTKIQRAELREEGHVIEQEADFEKRFKNNAGTINQIVEELKETGNLQKVEEDVLGRLSQQQIESLDKDIEYMIKEAKAVKQNAEVEPKEIEKLLTEDEEALRLLQDYVNRHSN